MNKDKRIRQLAVTLPSTGTWISMAFRMYSGIDDPIYAPDGYYHLGYESWQRVARLINSEQYDVHYNVNFTGITVHISRRSNNVS